MGEFVNFIIKPGYRYDEITDAVAGSPPTLKKQRAGE
jgi:hypothetical protein